MLLSIILVLTVLLQAEAPPFINNAENKVYECVTERGLDVRGLLKIALQGRSANLDNATYNALTGCIWEKMGLWTKDHKIDNVQLQLQIQNFAAGYFGGQPKDYIELAREVADTCKNATGANLEETSAIMQDCINIKITKKT